jgi:hypothetical protein
VSCLVDRSIFSKMTSANAQGTKLICLTPVKNEAWVFRRMLACASQWADHIMVADQLSTDGTREIAREFPKVILLDNPVGGYHEGQRQRIVFEAARRIPAERRVLIAVDSDEAVTGNWSSSPEWDKVRAAAPGTVIRFNWVNLLPEGKKCWLPPDRIAMGFVDDGVSSFSDGQFHVTRLPIPTGAPELILEDVKMLHFQYLDWERMKSKQARYQCFERIANPAKRAINLYRQYHHMDVLPMTDIHQVRSEWTDYHKERGIDVFSVDRPGVYPADQDVIEMLLQHGTRLFSKLDIWSVDWTSKAKELGKQTPPGRLADPRTYFERAVHQWLRATQSRKRQLRVRSVQWALRLAGW